MIEVKHISKTFGKHKVLINISAEFKAGMNTLIIGGSGSGKTTLLKCMAGLHEPDNGSVMFDGRNFTKMDRDDRKAVRQEIGMLFQNSALFDSMTVEQNVRFPLDMFTDNSEKKKKERVNFCLERVDLKGKNHLYPAELSGGMKKRVGIARAIAMNPKYLFVDEPNSGLDPQTALLIDELIQEITKEYNTTTVVVTHDMNSVMTIGDHIIFLYEGKKEWEGSNKEITKNDNQALDNFIFAGKFMQIAKKNM